MGERGKVEKIGSKGVWVGVALLKSPPEESVKAKGKRAWHELTPTEQAGVTANDPVFWRFLREDGQKSVDNEQHAAEYIRWYCGVKSRSEILSNIAAMARWDELHSKFTAWKLAG